jgi:hypothetical protein
MGLQNKIIKCQLISMLMLMHNALVKSDESKWKLVWNDEFNSDRIDINKWYVDDDKSCNGLLHKFDAFNTI